MMSRSSESWRGHVEPLHSARAPVGPRGGFDAEEPVEETINANRSVLFSRRACSPRQVPPGGETPGRGPQASRLNVICHLSRPTKHRQHRFEPQEPSTYDANGAQIFFAGLSEGGITE